MQNWRLEPTGSAKRDTTCGLTGLGLGRAHEQSVGWVFVWVWKRTDLFLWSKPWPLAGHLDPLLTLTIAMWELVCMVLEVRASYNGEISSSIGLPENRSGWVISKIFIFIASGYIDSWQWSWFAFSCSAILIHTWVPFTMSVLCVSYCCTLLLVSLQAQNVW